MRQNLYITFLLFDTFIADYLNQDIKKNIFCEKNNILRYK